MPSRDDLGPGRIALAREAERGGAAGRAQTVQRQPIHPIGQQRAAHVKTLAEAVGVQAQQLRDHERHRSGGPGLHRVGARRVGRAVAWLALRAGDELGQPLPPEAMGRVQRCRGDAQRRRVLAVAAKAGHDQ